MTEYELMVRLTLDHPWEIRHQHRLKADGPGFFTRLARRLRPAPAATEQAGLADGAAGRANKGAAADGSERRAA